MTKNIWLTISTIALITFIVLCIYFKCGIKDEKPATQTTIQEVVNEMFDDIDKAKAEKPAEVKAEPKVEKPVTVKAKKPNYIEILSKKIIKFQTNSTKIDDTSIADSIVEILKKDKSISLTITGHTDSVGSKKYNHKLAQKRADSIKKFLVKNGIDESRIVTKSQGELSPMVKNNSDENKAQNRRAEFKGVKI